MIALQRLLEVMGEQERRVVELLETLLSVLICRHEHLRLLTTLFH